MDTSLKMRLLGGEVEALIYDIPKPAAGRFIDSIKAEALRLQGIFNLYDPSSELSALNRGRTIEASPELSAVVSMALPYCELSRGAYDISLGKRFIARKKGLPLPDVSCSFRDISVDGRTITLSHPDALLDLGSIAKGYIGDRILQHMRNIGISSGFVDARGDMSVFGRHVEVVSVRHPREREKTVRPFALDDAAVATSGDYSQYAGSYRESHIVGETDIISATVVAPTLAQADALASCVFLSGSAQAGKLMRRFPRAKALAFDESLAEHRYNGFENMLIGGAEVGV